MGGNGTDDAETWLERMLRGEPPLRNNTPTESRRLEQDAMRQGGHVKNPFSAFKQLIDSNFGSMSSSLKNLPANIAELRTRMQREQEAVRDEEREISRRWTGSADSPDHIQMEVYRSSPGEKEEAFEHTLDLLDGARRKNQHIPPEKIDALYRDAAGDWGMLDLTANDLSSSSLSSLWSWFAPQPRWLSVDWFKRSPYSPIQLEAHPHLADAGHKWRAAFEELMNAALDKPIASAERVGVRPSGKPQSTYHGPGLEWMLSLQCRGILPPLLSRTHNCGGAAEVLRLPIDRLLAERGVTHESVSNVLSERQMFGFGDAVYDDFSELLFEVATKATSETQAEPLPKLLQQPETEQDLYDSAYLFSSTMDPEASERGRDSLSSSRDYQQHALLLAQKNQEKSKTETGSAVAEALDGPSPPWKLADLMRRGDALAGRPLNWNPLASIQEIENMVDRLQQEHENLHEMTGRGKIQAEAEAAAAPPPLVEKPDVLSLLTTTHTTRMPDGTVTTKVILKQRFADGREETSESVHTERPAVAQQEQQDPPITPQQKEEGSPGKGWFWT